ncbi:ABC transporter substrate-binding protein [Saccharothrix variisporea]|uniref:Carbohydrate ABC transporter substrate-binding protein (CUT1 family) n=1 Tax=Saccharothrix variisporea TaxID=543527 RepID=A0A495XLP7_9PSEU|nr:ABC transporter substrate-binding protein [Saccharothrix variisporea]RKT74125.1 carbohydrate ABC transporter substrate-binding protein (CUT1 family) [Saccharothrix variisporea]
MTAAPLRAAAALTAAALALTACGGGGNAASDDGKSFTYWSMWKENEPQAQVLAQAVADFEKETGIDVTVQWQGRDVLKKVVPALRGGDVPDLVDQEEAGVRANLVASDQFRDLSAVYAAEVPGSGKKVSEVVADKYTGTLKKDGKLFLVPYEIIGNGLWFDGSKLPGTAPTTWDELAALFAKAKGEGRAPIALDADIPYYNAYWTVGVLQGALGAGKVDELAKDKTGKAWDTPEVRAALGKVKALVDDKYFIDGYDGSKWPAVQEKWAQRQADFLLMGSWAPSETGPKAAQGFQFTFTPLPGAKTTVPVSNLGFAIPKPAKKAAAAEKFIAYFLKDVHLSKISTMAKNLTPNPELPVPDDLKGLGTALGTLPVSRPIDGIDEIPGYAEEAFYPVNDQLIKGKTDVDGFLSQLAEKQANYWKKNG